MSLAGFIRSVVFALSLIIVLDLWPHHDLVACFVLGLVGGALFD